MSKTAELLSPSASHVPAAESLPEAHRFCRAVAHRHGANFSVGFRFLPKRKREAVYAAYSFCRWADDIADDPGPDILPRLDAWQAELDSCYAGEPHHPITVALTDVLGDFDVPKSAFEALIQGCRQDTVKTRYETFDELLGYCELVAASISDISLSIFGTTNPDAVRYGRDLSTALQLTNVTRDIGDDLERDRIYIPRVELERFAVTEADLFARRETPAVRDLVLFQVDRALGYFRSAQPLLGMLSRDGRFPTLLMGAVYARVLDRIRREPFAPLHRRIRLTLAGKLAVIAERWFDPRFV